MIVQTKLAGERHFMFAMVYRFARAGICKAVTLRPVGLKSYVLKQSPCLFVQSNFNIRIFIEKLRNDLSEIQESAEVILLGDFNVDYQLRSTAKSRLQTLARAFSLEQLITSATRITQSSKSTIDLIFANNIHRVVASGVYSLDISDHSLIFCVIIKLVLLNRVEITATLTIVATKITIDTILNTIWRTLTGHLWIPNLEYHWQQFRELRNLVNNQIKLAKSKYYQDSVNANKDNPSNLWKALNELTSRNKSGTNPSCIISEEKPVTDQKSIATILNE